MIAIAIKEGVELVIRQLMTQAEEREARRKQLTDYIRSLKKRYPESERREVVSLLRNRLARLEMRIV